MQKQTSFDLEDAEVLLNQLQQFYESLQQEWSRVLNQWNNLQVTWRDEQFDKFEPLFGKLSSTYTQAETDCQKYISFINEQISRLEDRQQKSKGLPDIQTGSASNSSNNRSNKVKNKSLNRGELHDAFDKFVTAVSIIIPGIFLTGNTPVNPPFIDRKSPTYSWIQQQKSNTCSLNDKPDLKKSSAYQKHEALPKIARGMSLDEQLETIDAQDQEVKAKRRKRDREISTISSNSPKASGSPDPNPPD